MTSLYSWSGQVPEATPLERLFVANRGEIALRAIRAAHALGMETVLGVSSADRNSLGAREAGRTVVIGPPQARDSYLNAGLVVHAAVATGCTALHPGYGFLSERPELAQLCVDNGIIFVGPRAESIRQVGDKLSARALARDADVPLTSGSEKIEDVAEALKIAEQIGYPVITKASAGGGGRGMVVAHDADELAAAFDQASNTAREAFGDGTLFLERYVETARHIEVQLIGDGLGNVVHFGERDCSIQRRYQKMIEEAPAAVLHDEARARLHAAAISLLASINYQNAGTVEFLYDVERQAFSFMEVNARIQVEHPVSEAISGVDLVQCQLLMAMRPAKALEQVSCFSGHAIEARIIAEDPERDFIPCPGRVTRWAPPAGEGVRVDSAIVEGGMVPPFYDSMIAKLIVHGDSRDHAVERLAKALDQFHVEGIATNLPLLRFIVAHPDFKANNVDTRWLERVLLPAFRDQ
ncbi:acetyl/propionyl/methylcrotonyl-CoA carboxylase subunit alpha [Sphingomonas sp.]|uniref:acetyl-CoA carboxylase biotin carboxylase subunit n=1 Tax=Sphingomonas sp. TaxID=28214 RepID=UPI0037500EFA